MLEVISYFVDVALVMIHQLLINTVVFSMSFLRLSLIQITVHKASVAFQNSSFRVKIATHAVSKCYKL